MAIIVTKVPEEGLKYTPISQLGDERPFSVWVKPLDIKEFITLEDAIVQHKGDEISYGMGLFAFKVCQRALKNWENFDDADGKPITFTAGIDGVVSEELLSKIPPELISEIGTAVATITRDTSKIKALFSN